MSEMPPTPPAASPPPPPSGGSDSDRTIMLVLAYLGILSLIPLLVKKDDAEVQWHSKNGIVLCGAAIVLFIVFFVISFVPFVGLLSIPLNCITWIGYLVLMIVLIMKAVKGERMRLPVVTDIAEKL